MGPTRDLTIFISSTDSYADCWPPFFALWNIYWPDCPYRLVLNAESRSFTGTTPAVFTTCLFPDGSRPPWGVCTRRALEGIDTSFILWMQEDYFLKAPVNGTAIAELLELMRQRAIPHINLVQNPESTPWADHPHLRTISTKARYRASLQAGLWDRRHLLSIIMRHESPWLFEKYGSMRARSTPNYLCIGGQWHEAGPGMIVPYDLTGIVQGRWERRVVVDLFRRHGLQMDFSRRGFTDEPRPPRKKAPLIRRVWDHGRSWLGSALS